MNQRLVLFIAVVCIAQLGVTVFQHFEQQRSTPLPSSNPLISSRSSKIVTEAAPSAALGQKATSDTHPVAAPLLVSTTPTISAMKGEGSSTTNTTPSPRENLGLPPRKDPFVPFFAIRNNPTSETTDPLAQIELRELRVTAIIRDSSGDPSAVIETSQGRSFIVKKGNMIGTQGGRISEITSTTIHISEPSLDPTGVQTIATRELAMKARPTPFGMTVSTPRSTPR